MVENVSVKFVPGANFLVAENRLLLSSRNYSCIESRGTESQEAQIRIFTDILAEMYDRQMTSILAEMLIGHPN